MGNVAVSIHVLTLIQETGIMKIQNYAEKKSSTPKSIVKGAALQRWQATYVVKRKKIFLEILETEKQGHRQ